MLLYMLSESQADLRAVAYDLASTRPAAENIGKDLNFPLRLKCAVTNIKGMYQSQTR